MLPTLEQEIVGEGENVLKKAFARAPLLANLLIGGVHEMEHRMEQERQKIEGKQKTG